MQILVIEDEAKMAALIKRVLTAERHVVDVAPDGLSGAALAQRGPYDVIVLDRMLPDIDGVTLLRLLRGKGLVTPVLMLTALGAVDDRVGGLDAGADDYLPKPFAFAELIARIRALTRRRLDLATRLSYADLTLDTEARLASRGGRSVELTGREVDLLELLLRDPGRTLTRDRAIDEIWGGAAEPNVVDRYVTRLRRKLGEPPLIRTVRGAGFSLRV